jgi:hypothetical protein
LAKALTPTSEILNAAHTPDKALWLLEQSISRSPVGARGVLHFTRDVASALGSKLQYKDGKITTRLGTRVVVGSGYTGNGPVGDAAAAASDTNKWAYATGDLVVILGEKEIVNESVASGFKPSTNDYTVKATRPAAVFFDPTIHFSAQITLS